MSLMQLILILLIFIEITFAKPVEDYTEELENDQDKLDEKYIDNNFYAQYEHVRNSLNFTGKVALVTGSNSGIGAETVRQFSYLGAHVVVTGRNANLVRQVAIQCYRLSPYKLRPLEMVADLTVSGNPQKLVFKTLQTFGRIDILVNNAGICRYANITSANFTNIFNDTVAINELVPIQMIQLTVPYLRPRNGTIILVSSVAEDRAMASAGAYNMAKGAIRQLTRTLAQELGPTIRVNSVSPGYIEDTRIAGLQAVPEKLRQFYISLTSLGRNGLPLDVAKGIVFLASPLAEWITGISLLIDGGFTLTFG